MKAKNKVSIFFLGVGERSSQKAFLSENVHTGVSLSSPQRLITDPPAGLWAAVRLHGEGGNTESQLPSSTQASGTPRAQVPSGRANCRLSRLLASIRGNLSVCG